MTAVLDGRYVPCGDMLAAREEAAAVSANRVPAAPKRSSSNHKIKPTNLSFNSYSPDYANINSLISRSPASPTFLQKKFANYVNIGPTQPSAAAAAATTANYHDIPGGGYSACDLPRYVNVTPKPSQSNRGSKPSKRSSNPDNGGYTNLNQIRRQTAANIPQFQQLSENVYDNISCDFSRGDSFRSSSSMSPPPAVRTRCNTAPSRRPLIHPNPQPPALPNKSLPASPRVQPRTAATRQLAALPSPVEDNFCCSCSHLASDLPPGWEMALLEEEDRPPRPYFIDHNTRSTHWRLPWMPKCVTCSLIVRDHQQIRNRKTSDASSIASSSGRRSAVRTPPVSSDYVQKQSPASTYQASVRSSPAFVDGLGSSSSVVQAQTVAIEPQPIPSSHDIQTQLAFLLDNKPEFFVESYYKGDSKLDHMLQFELFDMGQLTVMRNALDRLYFQDCQDVCAAYEQYRQFLHGAIKHALQLKLLSKKAHQQRLIQASDKL